MIMRDMDYLNPIGILQFVALNEELKQLAAAKRLPIIQPFETYRTPERQRQMIADRTSKAGMWESAHQYGLAVDFVPRINGVWTWDVTLDVWDELNRLAKKHGLQNDIAWDRAHVEHPMFYKLRRTMAGK